MQRTAYSVSDRLHVSEARMSLFRRVVTDISAIFINWHKLQETGCTNTPVCYGVTLWWPDRVWSETFWQTGVC